ncbi:ring finger domain protein [Acrodontium crateriforme]|uniref:RING-type E3 ubiquitin transferase n=1 Tax=Acrodontium crateriforme TaxID=150365 RepID=A0AAQ3LYV0_9PEZI|nr:ring finger domain protein [Acrodontium crateriforme]
MDGSAGPAHIADEFKIKGAANRLVQKKLQDPCIICLEPITERAVAVPCNHLAFDFICLASWIQEISKCPLCKADVTEVQYDFSGPNDFKTYHVAAGNLPRQSLNTTTTIRRNHRGESAPLIRIDPSLRKRRRIYRDSLYSLHIGSNRHSGYQEITPTSFSASLELQSRCRAFLRRELQVFAFLDQAPSPRGGSRAYLIEYIVAIVKINDPKDASGHAVDLVADFLGRENASLLLHELMAWLRSPYIRLDEWDAQVQYVESTIGKRESG